MATSNKGFKLDSSAPLRRQQGERQSAYLHFQRWKQLGFCSDDELAADNGTVAAATFARYRTAYRWETRKNLYLARKQQSLGEQMYGEANAKKRATAKPLKKAPYRTGLVYFSSSPSSSLASAGR